jgi:hypothetical protein
MSCLFNSIGNLLEKKSTRKEICNYMERNLKKKIDGTEIEEWIMHAALVEIKRKPSVKKYIDRMKKNNSWGGGLEIMVACVLYNVEIEVKRKRRGGKIEICNFKWTPNPKAKLFLDYNGAHYEPGKIIRY